MTMDAWQRLAEVLGSRAPASQRSLRPAASARSTAAAQAGLEVVFHAEVRKGLERHDGAADFDDAGAFVPAALRPRLLAHALMPKTSRR